MTKVGSVLKFGDRGISVEEARKAMLAAGEAPSGIAREKGKNATAGFVEEEVPPAPPVAVAPAPAPVVPDLEEMLPLDDDLPAPAPRPAENAAPTPPEPPKPKVERFENDQFLGEIRQENGKWVAELQYKNGAGTEKWTRSTKNELMMALLEGKGNATLRVRAAKRRETMGVELDKALPLPEDMTGEEFLALPEKAQHQVMTTIATQQAMIFRDEHPEFVKSERNSKNIDDFLRKNNLPVTVRNLTHAYESLLEDGELDVQKPARSEAPTPSLAAPAPPKVVEDSTPAPAPVPAPAAAAPSEPGVVVRRRGSSGLQPGQSSVPSGDSVRPEDGGKDRDLSEAELRRLSPIGAPVSKDLRARANAERIANARQRV